MDRGKPSVKKLLRQVEGCADKKEALALVRRELGGVSREEADKWLKDNIPLEKAYQRRIMERIREEYPKAFMWKAAQGPYSTGGIPDICVVVEGRFVGIEVKRPFLGKPTALQEKAIKQIREAGGTAVVASLPEEALEAIRKTL